MSDTNRKLAHIEKIVNIRPIEGADRIEVATVLGWSCVTKKDEFKVGDKIVYVEVDSILPPKPEFAFLADRHYRIKIIKLRNQISQGLILPISTLPKNFHPLMVGTDVTDALGIVKYEPHQEKVVQGGTSKFPNWIVKTDEERIQNMPKILEREQGTLFEVSEKLDGQSATYFLRRSSGLWATVRSWFGKSTFEFGVCSRNLQLATPDNSSYWKIAKQNNIKQALTDIIGNAESVVMQGEIVGSGIQGNKYGLSGIDFFAFNLILSDIGKLNGYAMTALLGTYSINSVPFQSFNYSLPNTVKDLLLEAEGKSFLDGKVEREGLVFRNYEKGISFKAISEKFLLKYES